MGECDLQGESELRNRGQKRGHHNTHTEVGSNTQPDDQSEADGSRNDSIDTLLSLNIDAPYPVPIDIDFPRWHNGQEISLTVFRVARLEGLAWLLVHPFDGVAYRRLGILEFSEDFAKWAARDMSLGAMKML